MKISMRVRVLALRAAAQQLVIGRHVYLSTGCMVGEHTYCQSMTGMQGAKRGGRSKFTNAPCICRCHRQDSSRAAPLS